VYSTQNGVASGCAVTQRMSLVFGCRLSVHWLLGTALVGMAKCCAPSCSKCINIKLFISLFFILQ